MSLFVFNNQQKLIKSIPNRDLISVVQDQAINVSDTLFVELPADIWSNLKEPASYLAVQDPYERSSYHMYKVSKHTTKADTTDVEAIQIGYDELKAYGYIKDRRFNNRPVLEAATAVISGTDWQLGYVDTNLPNVNTNFYYISRLEALSKLIEATGAEVRFRIEISGNKIIAKRMDLYKKLGTFKGKRFAYGSNLLEIVKEEDTSELYTALVGRGKGEETDTGGFGRRITFADIAWDKASGKPVDKPLGQEFIELPEMTTYYGYPDGEPRTGIVEFGDIEEPEQLLKATYERLVEISRPQVQFKAKVQTTGDMQLGEEVAIIRSDLGFRYKTRVFRVKRDYLNNMYTEVELGDKLTETLASRIKKIDTTNARREETIIQYIQTAANGKNKIFRGVLEPTEGMMVNDLWYKPVGEGEIEMYQWNGSMWEQLVPTGMNDETVGRIEEAKGIAEGAKGNAKSAQVSADSILAGLGVETIGETHTEIVDTISLTLGKKADNAIIRQHIDDENGKLTTAINAIKDSPKEAIAGYNVLTQTVDGNVSTIASIKTTPETEIANYQRIVERADLYERVIGSSETSVKDNVSRIVMADSIFKTEVSDLLEYTSTTVSQLSDSWALNLKNGDDVVTAINASSQGVYIAGKNIVLDGNTVVDGTFTVTDEFFAESMNISKFTTGTLNAANVNLINVNVANIVGETSNFVLSNWNSNASDVRIDGSGVTTRSSDGSYSRLISGEVRSYNASGGTSAIMGNGRSQYYIGGSSHLIIGNTLHGSNHIGETSLQIAHTRNFAIGRYDRETHEAGVKLIPYITFDYGSAGNEDTGRMRFRKEIDLIASGFNFRSATQAIGRVGQVGISQNIGVHADSELMLGVNGGGSYSSPIRIVRDLVKLSTNLDMQGRAMINHSDTRLKTNIADSSYDVFAEAERIRVIEFEWDMSNPLNKNKPDGVHFGLQAQSTPFLQTKSALDESYLSIDLTKQINFNTLLAKRLNEERLKHQLAIDKLEEAVANIKNSLIESEM